MQTVRTRILSTLRWSEHITRTDMVYLASGGFWSALATLLSALIGLATATAFANLLPKTTYGTYQYILSAVTILGIVGLPGLKTAISYASSRGHDASFIDAVRAKIRWNTVSAFGALCMSVYYGIQGNTMLSEAFFVAAAFFPWWDVYGNYIPYLQGKKRFAELSMYDVGAQALNAIAIIAAVVLSDSVVVLCIAFFASWTFARLYFFRRALRLVPPNTERDPNNLSYAKHLSFMSIIGTIATNADKFVLWHFLGPVEVAVYTFAQAIPLRLVGALASVNRLYFPKAAVQDQSSIRLSLPRKIALMTFGAAFVAACYVVAAPVIFSFFFPQYAESILFSQILAVLIVLQPFSLFATALSAHARTKELYLQSVIPPLLQIMLFLALIPTMHVMGAVIALVAAQIVESAMLAYLFHRTAA